MPSRREQPIAGSRHHVRRAALLRPAAVGRVFLVVLFLLAVSASSSASADELPALKEPAAMLQAATVTVRVIPGEVEELPDGDALPADNLPGVGKPASASGPTSLRVQLPAAGARQVAVCSGVSLGDGLVVTYANLTGGARIRITLPGGGQAEAQLRVIDHISGLSLLEMSNRTLPGLKPTEQLPAVGEWVLTAAAWGAEEPIVSFGILSGTERTIPGATFPPLVQCDLRTAETSSGAPLVNKTGELVGVIVASDEPGKRSGWTYALPVRHVNRVLRARVADKVVVLRRRRPIAGLLLVAGNEPETVVVSRVDKNGPAEKAGIRSGDEIVSADGIKIRSVYQVIRPLLQKQPGDKMAFVVRQPTGVANISVTLGGGIELPEKPNLTGMGPLIERRIVVSVPVGFPQQRLPGENDEAAPAPVDEGTDNLSQRQRQELLQRQLDGYGVAIIRLREELQRRDAEQEASRKLIQTLEEEIKQLNRRITPETEPAPSGDR